MDMAVDVAQRHRMGVGSSSLARTSPVSANAVLTRLPTLLDQALASLRGSLRRSAIALVGVSVGIASVVAMLSMGEAARVEARRQLERLGADWVTLRSITRRTRGGGIEVGELPLAALESLSRLPQVVAVAPYVRAHEQARTVRSISIAGVTGDFSRVYDLRAARGRLLSDLDSRTTHAVAGASLARMLGVSIGDTVRTGDVLYTLAGVLSPGAVGPREFRLDRTLLVPLASAQRRFAHTDLRMATVLLERGVAHDSVPIQAHMERYAPETNVSVESPRALLEQVARQRQLFVLLLGAIGAVSLLVGGLGIMNVMLASVAERRPEIGLRRAVGATRGAIEMQFLLEAVVLCLAGSVIGVAIGVGGTHVAAGLIGWGGGVYLPALALGVAVAVLSGLAFGWYPARAAARLDPVQALRG